MKKILLITALGLSSLMAKSGIDIAKDLGINPSSKVIAQWNSIFDKKKYKKMFKRKLRKRGVKEIKKLSSSELNDLKKFLVSGAADSAKPQAAGSF